MITRTVEIPALQGATYNGKPAPGWTTYRVFKCSRCKRIRQSTSAYTTGYGTMPDKPRTKVCFACCGEDDRKALETQDRITLYLVKRKDRYFVVNWPGTLEIPVYVREGRHNIGRTRFDTWFSVAGKHWHGVNIGDNDILRCKRVKSH